jgi:hypothetical protein
MDPSKWNAEMAVTVDVALGTSNRAEMIGILSQILAVQKEGIATGAPVVSWPKIYNTLAKLVEAAGLKSVDHYFDDPSQAQPKPQQPNPLVEAENVKAQAAMQQEMMKLEHQKALRAFELEEQAKQNLLQLGLKKMDIESKERLARQNTTTDLLKIFSTASATSDAPREEASKSDKDKRPRKISVRRNPITREVEEIIPIYDEVDEQLSDPVGDDQPFNVM